MTSKFKLAAAISAALASAVLLAPVEVLGRDTDVFTATSAAAAPNVLFVLDNTSNWSRNNQFFSDGNGGTITQGQAEVAAIKSVINSLTGSVNVGMMEFIPSAGSGTDNGGYVRQAIAPMGTVGANAATNRSTFSAALDRIYNNITDSQIERNNSSLPYGNLFYDVYNYLAGNNAYAQSSNVPASVADVNGYTTSFTRFKSPFTADNTCGATYIIFIGNPPSRGPTGDSGANLTALSGAGGDTSQLPLQAFTSSTVSTPTSLGYSSACFTAQPTGTPADYAGLCPPSANSAYTSCSYSTSDTTTGLPACPSGQSRYSVVATTPVNSSSNSVVTTSTNTGSTNSCYASPASWTNSDKGTVPACPANTTSTVGNVTTTTTYSCNYAVNSTVVSSCADTVSGPTTGTPTTSSANSLSCYSKVGNGSGQWNSSLTDHGNLVCPANTNDTSGNPQVSTAYSCSYSGVENAVTTGCTGKDTHVTVTQTATPSVTTTTKNSKYQLVQTVTKTVTTTTSTGSNTTTTLGNTFACYASAPTGTPTDYSCPSGATCSYGAATSAAICPSGSRYQAIGYADVLTSVPTNPAVYATDTATFNADEWARFMYQKGIPVTGTDVKAYASTFTVDVYGAQPDARQSSLLTSMATNSGGNYYSATNANAIRVALQNIFSKIQSKNSTFASAALPVSASTRTQNGNEVFVGTFRPDSRALPRWFGNLKKYALGNVSGSTDLVDSTGKSAVNPTTGFFEPCAASYWNYDTGNYWANVSGSTVSPRVFFTQATTAGKVWDNVGDDLLFAKSDCTTLGSTYSDFPDGPSVEKGGVAAMLRGTVSSPKTAATRTVQTLSGSTLVTFNTTNVTLSADSTVNTNLVSFVRGTDVTGEIGFAASTSVRPSVHGSVIHSRPLAIDYGGTTGVKVFYGSNDGTYKAINSSTGAEEWSFVAPEFFPYLQRLLDNTPVVQTPSPTPAGQTAAPGTGANDFFDGSSGVYQTFKNVTSGSSTISVADKVWVYPTMRRGGRMIYGFDMSSTNSSGVVVPTFKWKAGCDSAGTCTTGMDRIGQTWSTPNVANVPGYPNTTSTSPVLVVGGGYDSCDDDDAFTNSCSSTPLGNVIYVLDADTGAVVKSFTTSRSVAGDVSLVDVNQDGKVDAAYAADTGGNLYRINFTDPTTFAARTSASWTITRVGYTSGGGRKFLFAPALLPYKNKVYVSIGTGDREHPTSVSYPYTQPVVNRFYTYLDDPSALDGASTVAVSLDSLNDRTTSSLDTCDTSKILPTSTDKGWFFSLNENGRGEQTVTSALIASGVVFFNTNRPIVSNATCSNPLGEARGYAVNLLNGSGAVGATNKLCGGNRSAVFVGGGLAPSPVSGVVKVGDVTQIVVIGGVKLDGTTNTPIGGQKLQPTIGKTRKKLYYRSNTDTR